MDALDFSQGANPPMTSDALEVLYKNFLLEQVQNPKFFTAISEYLPSAVVSLQEIQ
jgi:hypothetical protein